MNFDNFFLPNTDRADFSAASFCICSLLGASRASRASRACVAILVYGYWGLGICLDLEHSSWLKQL